MNPVHATVLGQIAEVRKQLSDKRDRIRQELATVGQDPGRLPADKRSTFSSSGFALRLLDDLEAQLFGGALEDVPGAIGQLIAVLKQLQKAALPGTATPAHGSQVVPPKPVSGVRAVPAKR